MKYLIVGGTGTLGRALTKALLKSSETQSIVCFSRDELKQKELSSAFNDPRLRCVLGDIRDFDSLVRVMSGIDVVFHVAALKHVDTLEANPEECVKTNILGTMNVADAAIVQAVPYVIFSSTDKAESPVNVYGMSKGISEKILLNQNLLQSRTKFSVYRWGNVIASRGSALSFFAKTLKEEGRAYITDLEMTRFWIRIEDAVGFMLGTYEIAAGIMAPATMLSSPITSMVDAISELVNVPKYETQVTGVRPGEKIHETLFPGFSSETGPHYTVEELKELVGPYL